MGDRRGTTPAEVAPSECNRLAAVRPWYLSPKAEIPTQASLLADFFSGFHHPVCAGHLWWPRAANFLPRAQGHLPVFNSPSRAACRGTSGPAPGRAAGFVMSSIIAVPLGILMGGFELCKRRSSRRSFHPLSAVTSMIPR